jgi:hypothetical protein
MTLLTRADTPLQPQRGIATEGGLPVAIQVQFTGGQYPDRLLPDGSIEHIGEGSSGEQKAQRGNAAMLNAIEQRTPFPVYEKVGKNQYRLLGKFVALGHALKSLDPENKPDWIGFVFTLKPVWKPDETIKGWDAGGAPPRETDVQLRVKIELAAMEAVRSYFSSRGYDIEYVHKENLGWDIKATRGNDILHLEVKGRSADSFTVELTPNEFEALKTNSRFRLCIVRNALRSPTVNVFKLSANETQLFDDSGILLSISVREGAVIRYP